MVTKKKRCATLKTKRGKWGNFGSRKNGKIEYPPNKTHTCATLKTKKGEMGKMRENVGAGKFGKLNNHQK